MSSAPTAVSVAPVATSAPEQSAATPMPEPPRSTPEPPTATAIPPTATPVPSTPTPEPPTATPTLSGPKAGHWEGEDKAFVSFDITDEGDIQNFEVDANSIMDFRPIENGHPQPKRLKMATQFTESQRVSKIFAALQTVPAVWEVSRLWVLATPGGGAFSIDWRNNTPPAESLSKKLLRF